MNTEDRIGCRCERGVALVIALMATVLLTALGSALILLSVAETDISVNYRNAQEALYGADAGIERAVQDLLSLPQWDPVLAGAVQSTFVDGTLTPTLPAGSSLDLDAATRRLQDESDASLMPLRYGVPTIRSGSSTPTDRSPVCCRHRPSRASCTSSCGLPMTRPNAMPTRFVTETAC